MDTNKLRSYASRLISCAIDNNPSSPYQEDNRRTDLMVRGDIEFLLDVDKYKQLRKDLLEKEQWEEKFSEEFIDKALRNILFRIREEHTNKNAFLYLQELVQEVKTYSTEQIVYIPLAGIKLNVEALRIGNIKLFSMTDSQFNNIAKQVGGLISNQAGTAEQKQQLISIWLRDLKGNICAEYRCIADSDRAEERAYAECQRVFDLIRFAIHIMGQDHYRATVGFLGEISRSNLTIPVISSDAQSFAINSSTKGPLAPFNIDSRTIERMEELGIFRVAELLKQKLKEDSFEETLLRGIRWFSNAQVQVVRENQLLNLTTCLETFLTRRGMEQITNTVAEGVAFVLSTNLVERKRMKGRILDFYNLRSRISHEGRSAVLSSELEEFKSIVGNFLKTMIQKIDTFRTNKDLADWIETQKML